jgi:YbbR domain-containing protein
MKNLITNNLGLKISAVLISVSLWFIVTSRGQSEISLDVPVEFKNIPAGLEIVNYNTRTVNVTIKGHERAMRNIKALDIRAFIDMGKAKKGEGSYYINKDDVKLPYAVTVESIKPSMLKIRLEETFEKTVSIKTVLIGLPEDGFRVKAINTEPDKVKIRGIKSEVMKIKELQTEPFDITGFNKTVTQELNINVSDTHVRPDIETVKVKIHITGKKI